MVGKVTSLKESSGRANAGQGMVISTHLHCIRIHQALNSAGKDNHVTRGKLDVGHF